MYDKDLFELGAHNSYNGLQCPTHLGQRTRRGLVIESGERLKQENREAFQQRGVCSIRT